MSKRAPAIHREYQPLKPSNSATLVSGEYVLDISPDDITIDKVGLKAFGLVSIPQVWIKPFFIVSGDATPTPDSIRNAMQRSGMRMPDRVIVRSSGVMESIDQRGTLESAECDPRDIGEKITQLKESILKKNSNVGLVHWIVQVFIAPSTKGHLSNERRLCKDIRDWLAEVEPSTGYLSETHKIAIREWRDARQIYPQSLICKYRVNCVESLKQVARWAYERQLRIHFEWVWDSKRIYIVQADECRCLQNGVIPKELVQIPTRPQKNINTEIFRIATSKDFSTYRKLSNASIYQNLGYQIVNFFVLDSKEEINKLIKEGQCSKKLLEELNALTINPLIIRTDGTDIPSDKGKMLPRSEELRSSDAAKNWLLIDFRQKIIDLKLDGCHLCLIAHHFVPAAASAWCQAYPDRRKVRIESLWGIPEGLYWYAHDVFDIDTLVNVTTFGQPKSKDFIIRDRLRYKGQFIAPNCAGGWVLHQTDDKSAWQRSIRLEKWIKEIAWTSRCIATAENKPVVVMWFVDVPRIISSHSVMPWYHEEWKNQGGLLKAAPRKKLPSSTEFIIRSVDDWKNLESKFQSPVSIVRVIVDPRDPRLFRDQQFAKDLAALAKEKNFVVELSGGILSHAYYLLASSGCRVECADLYATEDEELEFNKLVRDKIPDYIVASGENVELLKLESEALIEALKRKVIEEAFEVADSKTSQQLIEELADLYEVIDALASKLGIEKKTIVQTQKQKATKRGKFEYGLMLTRTNLASSLGQNDSEKEESLFSAIPSNMRTISGVEQLPSQISDIHIDKRRDFQGILERQLTLSLPAHTHEVKTQKTHFSLETQNGYPHELMLEVTLERTNANLRCKFRLINAPVQLELPMSDFPE